MNVLHMNEEKLYTVHMSVAGVCGPPHLLGTSHSMPRDAHWVYVYAAWEKGGHVIMCTSSKKNQFANGLSLS